ncbi:hypothetical protein OAH87_04240 [Marinomonas sp.]|nr:hypothetical protein [Marinomonas sp.]MDB4837658.1 hypothetical protein [Marinomonas sp.]
MKYFLGLLLMTPFAVVGQTVELRGIDIYYGNEVIRTQHQVVESSSESVSIIPVEKDVPKLDQNIVLGGNGSVSYVEEGRIAEREQAIYEEVNQRTKDSPFTVLFTGNVPQEIEERRMRIASDFGLGGVGTKEEVKAEASAADVFGSSSVGGPSSAGDSGEGAPDVGAFAPIGREAPAGATSTQ